ncbi:MAG: alpha/beta hydrolase [Planctomycetaceae bacterium]|jgi:pimeloyl-ACP methyl ester carboxylesterase|nr:alpha/beta hydrolase [Planctomycetaceae bacterium]
MNQNNIDQNNVTNKSNNKVIVFVPGLGADHRLFKYQTEYFPNSIAVNWIDPIANETLEEYAVRMATEIRSKLPPEIDNHTIVICGLSLGGMIAPYIANELNAAAYILLCSIRKPSQFPRRYYLDWLITKNCIMIRRTRIFFMQLLVKTIKLLPNFIHRSILPDAVEQIASMPTRKFAELSRMMFDWAYKKRDTNESHKNCSDIPSIHIHGNRDMLLPIKLTNPDIIIEGGGHILALTHPNQINEHIQKFILRIFE